MGLIALFAFLISLLLALRRAAARDGRTWLTIGVCAVVFTCFGLLFHRPIVHYDGAGYYAQARSLMIDGDLDYRNELRMMPTLGVNIRQTPAGRLGVPFSIGPALFWMAWFPGLGLLARASGVEADGLSWPYLWMVSLVSLALTAGAIALAWRAALLVRPAPNPDRRLPIVLLFVLATAAPLYGWYDPSYSHAYQFVASALACWWCMRLRAKTGESRGAPAALLTGIILGLNWIIRWQSLFMVVAFLGPLRDLARGVSRTRWASMTAVAAAGFALVASVQVAVLRVTWGSGWSLPTMSPDFLNPAQPAIGAVLFSSWNGLLTYHPVMLLGVCALVALGRRPGHRWLAAGIALWMGSEVYAVASTRDWWGGGGFGQRRLVSLVPWLATAVALWLADGDESPHRASKRASAITAVVAALAVWNFLLAGAFTRGFVPQNPGEPAHYAAAGLAPYETSDRGAFYTAALRGAARFLQGLLHGEGTKLQEE